ncbi:amidohydrolase/deacetylase family metallohydrolase [Acidaminobacter sp. JC074]|uniref:amidohydrolase/deacetylase family metallohydrolase n=1 Tax=Acidaminobacter sp. JC074 TaxID=2530199 RepID=UPI001F0D59F9|nr:amidohydrolase/deacetylase family metallohydrolase [Acidaminobacter sp. JC074]MCH4887915.1 amidohydrolase/deacetylase family metallohydrolase [Acidaminobacter sp. JC074]
MKRLLIKNANIIDVSSKYHKQCVDIYIEDGVIKKIDKDLNEMGQVFDISSYLISPGFIDAHVHCYHGKTVIGIDPEKIGVKTGVTSLIDAGTAGANTIDDFYNRIIKKSEERVFVLLNTASDGLKTLSELSTDGVIDKKAIKKAIERYQDTIVGIKARASSSVLLDKGIGPIAESKNIATELGLPLVIHIGNAPPKVEEVLDLTSAGDVITHCYHNKVNGLFLESGIKKGQVANALHRQVKFDIGHGSSSFSFDVFEKAVKNGFRHDFIGSDIYDKNIGGPVVSLINVMNKVLACDFSLDDVVSSVTSKVSEHFKLSRLGTIKVGNFADFTVYKLHDSRKTFVDSVGQSRTGKSWIEAKYTLVEGEIFRVENGGEMISFDFLKDSMSLTQEQMTAYDDDLRYIDDYVSGHGIKFQDHFKLGFYSHMVGFIDRLKNKEKLDPVDESIKDNIEEKAFKLTYDLIDSMSKKYEVETFESEVILASIHIQTALAMEED